MWPDHLAAIAPGKPSRPGPRGQGRSADGVLHIDPVGLARSPIGRVDGDGMIRQAWAHADARTGPGRIPPKPSAVQHRSTATPTTANTSDKLSPDG